MQRKLSKKKLSIELNSITTDQQRDQLNSNPNCISVISDINLTALNSPPPQSSSSALHSPTTSITFNTPHQEGLRKLSPKVKVRRWSSKSSSTSADGNASRRNSDGRRIFFSKINRQEVPTLRQSYLKRKKEEYEGLCLGYN